MSRGHTMFSLAFVSVLIVACGSTGDVGESCDTPGSTEECVENAICTNVEGDASVCFQICVDKADCGPDEDCNGVSSSSIKSCQPN